MSRPMLGNVEGVRQATPNLIQSRVTAELSGALRRLGARSRSDGGVHDARKHLKRARAGLRLLRRELGEARYRNENRALRDAGRLLAPLRDAKARVQVFETFVDRHACDLDPEELQVMGRGLRSELLATRKQFGARSRKILQCRKIIRQHRDRLAHVAFRDLSTAAMLEGLERIYRKARKGSGEACADALHEWRKRVKYLRDAIDILEYVFGKHAAKTGRKADRLGDLLGDDHDLVVLAGSVAGRGAHSLRLKTQRRMQSLIEARRAKLQRRARRLAHKLFTRKPAKFIEWVSAGNRLCLVAPDAGEIRT